MFSLVIHLELCFFLILLFFPKKKYNKIDSLKGLKGRIHYIN
jgi:hypothetical protein